MKYSLIPIIIFFSCASIITSPSLYGTKTYGNVAVDSIIKVNSGTNFKANLKDYPDIIGKDITVYIYGVLSPSLKTKNQQIKKLALQAQEFTTKALKKAKQIELRSLQRGKNFIIVSEVYVDGENLAKKLLRARLAKQYYGGPKPRWE